MRGWLLFVYNLTIHSITSSLILSQLLIKPQVVTRPSQNIPLATVLGLVSNLT